MVVQEGQAVADEERLEGGQVAAGDEGLVRGQVVVVVVVQKVLAVVDDGREGQVAVDEVVVVQRGLVAVEDASDPFYLISTALLLHTLFGVPMNY